MSTITVRTETSTYVLDLDAMTATRLPGTGAGALPGLPPVETADLRRDAEPIPLLARPEPVVGRPLELLLQVREDGIPTVRVTNVVCEVV